jgi:L-asparaginase/archaeal Glu-tRNAGln amidotransferase subunit D
MMKKILLIMTGGTICSFKNSTGYNAADVVKAAPLLIDVLRNSESRARDAEFDVIKPLDTLSENMSVEKWNILLDSLRETDISSYAGIIIAHGTDTLHLTAALIARVLKGCPDSGGICCKLRNPSRMRRQTEEIIL